MAEHSAVNRRVVGSSPTCGAISGQGRWKLLQRPFLFAMPSRTGSTDRAVYLAHDNCPETIFSPEISHVVFKGGS
jgi:hypothetical protein